MLDRLKIDVAVHGRFHAFHLARALHEAGHDVRLLTNYPRVVVQRFGFPRSRTLTCVAHGVTTRMFYRLARTLPFFQLDAALHQWFGRWVRSKVRKDANIIYIFSGVSEETLQAFGETEGTEVWVVRGSSHIRVQSRLLEEEESRSGVSVEKPSAWMISREEREYAMARRVITLSSFAKRSFVEQRVSPEKVTLLLSAVDVSRFRPDQEIVRARLDRIRNGSPLRVLTVGSFSVRKGAYDLVEIAKAMAGCMSFRFVGDVPAEALALKKRAGSAIEFVPRVPEYELKRHYGWGDIFVFPTIEDGFPAVLGQALASGTPTLATPNSCAPDIVRHGETGWILPIRSPSMFIDQLNWCDAHRNELQEMVQRLYFDIIQRDWKDMASDLYRIHAASRKTPQWRAG
jgi:glycosyltransferase involved in cell wall biosynthesis